MKVSNNIEKQNFENENLKLNLKIIIFLMLLPDLQKQ